MQTYNQVRHVSSSYHYESEFLASDALASRPKAVAVGCKTEARQSQVVMSGYGPLPERLTMATWSGVGAESHDKNPLLVPLLLLFGSNTRRGTDRTP